MRLAHSLTAPASDAIPSPKLGPDLFARIVSGDPDALTALFHVHERDVRHIALLIRLSSDDADDVVQDVFIGLPEALRGYTERGTFTAWLKTVTTHAAMMRVRARGRRVTAVDPATLAELASVVQPDRVTFLDAIGRLPVDQRTVFILKVVEGYRHDEIAETLGISRNTSEVRLFRAIRALRVLLEDRP